jgi:hypothetical protein
VTILALCLSGSVAGAQVTTRVRLTGSVLDSITMTPLAGAAIQLVSAADSGRSTRSARSDSLGNFAVDSLPVGAYLIGFYHPMLDLLAMEEITYAVAVQSKGSATVSLATPSPATVFAKVCGVSPTDSSGLLMGRLFDATSRTMVDSGQVVVQWPVATIEHGTLRVQSAELPLRVDSTGRFGTCEIPPHVDATVIGVSHGDSTGSLTIHTGARGVVLRDLFVGTGQRVAIRRPDSSVVDSAGATHPGTTLEQYLRGSARVTGVIHTDGGLPIEGARVSLPDAGLQTVTNKDGIYILANLPAGTHSLSVRAIGHFPDDRPVDLYADSTVRGDVRLSTVRAVLDTMRIVGKRMSRGLAEFDRRRRSSMGSYVTGLQIMKDKPFETADLVTKGRAMTRAWDSVGHLKIGLHGQLCLPLVYIDGIRFTLFDDLIELNTMVRPDEIAAMELYRGEDAPMEYGFKRACAVLIIWRK